MTLGDEELNRNLYFLFLILIFYFLIVIVLLQLSQFSPVVLPCPALSGVCFIHASTNNELEPVHILGTL